MVVQFLLARHGGIAPPDRRRSPVTLILSPEPCKPGWLTDAFLEARRVLFSSVNGAVIDGRLRIESIPIPPRVIPRYGPRAQPDPEGIPSAPTPRPAKSETKAKPTASEAEAIEAKAEVVETESAAEAEAIEAEAEVVETESAAEAEAVSTKA